MTAVALAGCGEGDRAKQKAEQAKKDRETAERTARYQAEREAEKLVADRIIAEEAFNKRIDEWIIRQGGLLLVKGEWSSSRLPRPNASWHSMPDTTPWFVSCGRGGATINLGNWSGGSEEINTIFGLHVSHAPLSDERCKEMVVKVGQKMLAVTSGK